GAEVVLALPLPDVAGGAFALSNLSLGAHFALDAVPKFQIRGGVHVASPRAPFTLVVGALGGAGWFQAAFLYQPGGAVRATVDVGIMAAASIAVRLGPISGGVYAYFGIVVNYEAVRGRSSRLQVAL